MARSQRSNLLFAASMCSVISLTAGQTPIRTLTDPTALSQQQFGSTVASLGDLDGDGFGEVAVSAIVDWTSFVDIFSSSTGALMRQHVSTQGYQKLGRAVVSIGDVDGDGTADYAIGSDGWDVTSRIDAGMFTIFSGASGATILVVQGPTAGAELGYSIAATGDVDGDLIPDVLVGSSGSGAWVYSASGTLIHTLAAPAQNDRFGCAVAGLGDLNNDGRGEFAVGASQQSSANGYVRVYNGYDKSLRYTLMGPSVNSRFGQCVRSMGDLDGDGRRELAVGSPIYYGTSGGEGLVQIFSGINGGWIRNVPGHGSNQYFGSSIDSGADLDADGFDDLIVGEPNARNVQISGAGAACAVSGASGVRLFEVRGTNFYSNLGMSVAWVPDLDGDGRMEFVAGSYKEVITGAGVLFSGACAPPGTYCSAKVNSLGCVPAISFTGNPSLATTDNFHIRVSNAINNKPGLVFYGLRPSALPLTGGVRCVDQILHRSAGQSSGGNQPPNDCSGVFDFFLSQADLVADNFAVGQTLYAQVWYRDPGFPAPGNAGLSDALRFTICD
ncbi:MAG: FG-GAP repeat protein [Planctomycetes bacterium]|nr:FG-GAP repeat protein [Planctomycetota bacterium]